MFLDLATMAPLILQRRDFLPQFADDVAFNFEYVPLAINATEVEEASSKKTEHVQNAHGSFATAVALATLKKAARVWDCRLRKYWTPLHLNACGTRAAGLVDGLAAPP